MRGRFFVFFLIFLFLEMGVVFGAFSVGREAPKVEFSGYSSHFSFGFEASIFYVDSNGNGHWDHFDRENLQLGCSRFSWELKKKDFGEGTLYVFHGKYIRAGPHKRYVFFVNMSIFLRSEGNNTLAKVSVSLSPVLSSDADFIALVYFVNSSGSVKELLNDSEDLLSVGLYSSSGDVLNLRAPKYAIADTETVDADVDYSDDNLKVVLPNVGSELNYSFELEMEHVDVSGVILPQERENMFIGFVVSGVIFAFVLVLVIVSNLRLKRRLSRLF